MAEHNIKNVSPSVVGENRMKLRFIICGGKGVQLDWAMEHLSSSFQIVSTRASILTKPHIRTLAEVPVL